MIPIDTGNYDAHNAGVTFDYRPSAPAEPLASTNPKYPGNPAWVPSNNMPNRVDDVVAAYPLFPEERGGSIPTSTLELRIEEINLRLAQELNMRWHSMLPRTDLGNLLAGTTTVAFGALAYGGWYAVAIWTQPIIASQCDGRTIELRRLAIASSAPPNTASRMLGVMRRLVRRKFPHIQRLISYLAIDVHSGAIYKAAGWKPVGVITAARPQRFSNRNRRTRATGPLQTNSRKQRWETFA